MPDSIDDILDEICVSACENVDEPAGSGCGYGITEDGQSEIRATLERLLRAPGTVPDAKPITKGDMSMKNSRFDIEIVKEKTDDKGNTTNGIVVKRYTKWHISAEAAKEYAKKKHGIAILEQEEAGFEVAILVHPFCS